MNIYINNEAKELHEGAAVSELLEAMSLAGRKGIAVAVNNEVVPQAQWSSHRLSEADKITLIKATQGG